MRSVVTCVIVGACTFINGASAQEKPVGLKISSLASVGCEAPESGTPEIYSFFGEGAKVLEKVGNLNVELPKRKIYLLLVEGPDSAEVFLYERAGEGKVNLSRLSTKSTGAMREEIEKGIVSNRGIHCIGEQTKAVFLRHAKEKAKSESSVDSPESVKAALSHSIQTLNDKFIRVTVILLC